MEGDLGKPIRVFRAKLTTCIVVAVCGLVLLCGGAWLTFEMEAVGPGPYVVTLGVFVLGIAFLLARTSYTVCQEGIIVERFGFRRNCRWTDVVEIVDRHTKQGLVTSRSCVLRGKAGQMELHGLGNDFDGMMALVRAEAQRRQIPIREEHVNAKEANQS